MKALKPGDHYFYTLYM